MVDAEKGRRVELGGLGDGRVVDEELSLEFGEGDEAPQRPAQLVLRQLGSKPKVLKRQLVVAPVLPAEQDSHLECMSVQIYGGTECYSRF